MSAFASFTYAPDPPPPDEAEHLKNHDLEAECIIDYFNSLLEKLRQHDPTLIEIDFTGLFIYLFVCCCCVFFSEIYF